MNILVCALRHVQKVLAAIAQLRFKPNPIARSMISKRTGSIGVIVPFFTRPFHVEVLRGVQNALSQAQKELVIYNVENDMQRDAYFSELPMHRKVDGLLIVSLIPSDTFAQGFREVGLPTVLVDAYSPHLTSLVVNNAEGAYQAVKSLLTRDIGVSGLSMALLKETLSLIKPMIA